MRNKVPAKTRLFILLLLPACVGAVFAAGTKQISAVASVNGVLIPKAYLEREVRRFEEQALGQGQSLDENRKAQISREALDTLIDMELLYQESQRRGFQVSDQRIQEQVDRLREQFEGEEGYAAALEQIGISDGELRTELGRQLAIQEMIDRDIVPSTTVSEQELSLIHI